MSQYSKEELSLVIQALLPLGLIGGLAILFISDSGGFSWFTLLGISVGLSIIAYTWIGKKSSVFVASLLIAALVLTPLYNMSTLI